MHIPEPIPQTQRFTVYITVHRSFNNQYNSHIKQLLTLVKSGETYGIYDILFALI